MVSLLDHLRFYLIMRAFAPNPIQAIHLTGRFQFKVLTTLPMTISFFFLELTEFNESSVPFRKTAMLILLLVRLVFILYNRMSVHNK